MTIHADVLIAGAGHGGGMAAVQLRQGGFTGSITLLGDEAELPYERPALSKAYLKGEIAAERLQVRNANYWAERDITIHANLPVTAVDPAARTVNAAAFAYQTLIWAAGGRARPLGCPGADKSGIHYLRSRADADALRAALLPGVRLVIIGGGYIGLEVAASARKLGADVTVLEAQDRLLARVTSPVVSHFYAGYHQAQGVRVRTDAQVVEIVGDACVTGVTLSGGEIIAADVVVVGIGILPNIEPLAAAGIACDNGVLVDDYCRTSDPHIYALGDCTRHPNAFAGGLFRLESVQNTVDQGKTIAAVLNGAPVPYHALPWFWSDQYDLKLQTAGLAMNYDATLVRGDPAHNSFSLLYLRDSKIIAIDAINAVRDFLAAKNLIVQEIPVAAALLGDINLPLKTHLTG